MPKSVAMTLHSTTLPPPAPSADKCIAESGENTDKNLTIARLAVKIGTLFKKSREAGQKNEATTNFPDSEISNCVPAG